MSLSTEDKLSNHTSKNTVRLPRPILYFSLQSASQLFIILHFSSYIANCKSCHNSHTNYLLTTLDLLLYCQELHSSLAVPKCVLKYILVAHKQRNLSSLQTACSRQSKCCYGDQPLTARYSTGLSINLNQCVQRPQNCQLVVATTANWRGTAPNRTCT